MRLVIHAGLHKTASTSFQKFCAANRDILAQAGVFYPELEPGSFHHNALAHRLQHGDDEHVDVWLGEKVVPKGGRFHTVLLSGEDFEFFLGHRSLARRFEELVLRHGFASIAWHFVLRDRWQYLSSQYAELSKHDIVTSFRTMAEQVLAFGSYACANRHLRRYYEFDYERSLPAFQQSSRGSVAVHDFAQFCKGIVGTPLLHELGGEDLLERLRPLWDRLADGGRDNRRSSWLVVEYRYACAFLDLDAKQRKWAKLPLLLPFILLREAGRRRAEARFEAPFRAAFPKVAVSEIEQRCLSLRNDAQGAEVPLS